MVKTKIDAWLTDLPSLFFVGFGGGFLELIGVLVWKWFVFAEILVVLRKQRGLVCQRRRWRSRYAFVLAWTFLFLLYFFQIFVDLHRYFCILALHILFVNLLELEYRSILDQKRVVQSLSSRNPLLRLPLEQLAHKIDPIPCDFLIFLGLIIQLAFFVFIEDRVPTFAWKGLFTN